MKDAAHFAFVAFFQDHVIPVVGAFTTAIFNIVEFSDTIFQLHAIDQALHVRFSQHAHHAHRIFALDFITGVHQAIRQLARGGEEQQTAAIDIQPPN